LEFKAGVDVGRAWQLQVYVNDKQVFNKLIDGLYESRRQREDISIDLSDYKHQKVVWRLYQRVLVLHHEAGDAYWRDLSVQ
jgi:hypothetical protein